MRKKRRILCNGNNKYCHIGFLGRRRYGKDGQSSNGEGQDDLIERLREYGDVWHYTLIGPAYCNRRMRN